MPGHFRNECPKLSEGNENMSLPTVSSIQEKHLGNGTDTDVTLFLDNDETPRNNFSLEGEEVSSMVNSEIPVEELSPNMIIRQMNLIQCIVFLIT